MLWIAGRRWITPTSRRLRWRRRRPSRARTRGAARSPSSAEWWCGPASSCAPSCVAASASSAPTASSESSSKHTSSSHTPGPAVAASTNPHPMTSVWRVTSRYTTNHPSTRSHWTCPNPRETPTAAMPTNAARDGVGGATALMSSLWQTSIKHHRDGTRWLRPQLTPTRVSRSSMISRLELPHSPIERRTTSVFRSRLTKPVTSAHPHQPHPHHATVTQPQRKLKSRTTCRVTKPQFEVCFWRVATKWTDATRSKNRTNSARPSCPCKVKSQGFTNTVFLCAQAVPRFIYPIHRLTLFVKYRGWRESYLKPKRRITIDIILTTAFSD